jgi:type I restriction enzyme M protein
MRRGTGAPLSPVQRGSRRVATETTTVIKKILPYLKRLGYVVESEMFFETAVRGPPSKVKGFVDIEIHHNGALAFLIEAKRDELRLSDKHRAQALGYGKECRVPFVAITNGQVFEIWNVTTGLQVTLNGERDFCPSKADLSGVLTHFKRRPKSSDLKLSAHASYRPGVTLHELTNIFKRCHNVIRDIEKDDEHAFSDFSKLLFLKLLEEKSDDEQLDPHGFRLPYTQRFADLSAMHDDAVRASVHQMFNDIQRDAKYGEVLKGDKFYIEKSKTYKKIASELEHISLSDSDVDVKGSAFEYFLKYRFFRVLRGSRRAASEGWRQQSPTPITALAAASV